MFKFNFVQIRTIKLVNVWSYCTRRLNYNMCWIYEHFILFSWVLKKQIMWSENRKKNYATVYP